MFHESSNLPSKPRPQHNRYAYEAPYDDRNDEFPFDRDPHEIPRNVANIQYFCGRPKPLRVLRYEEMPISKAGVYQWLELGIERGKTRYGSRYKEGRPEAMYGDAYIAEMTGVTKEFVEFARNRLGIARKKDFHGKTRKRRCRNNWTDEDRSDMMKYRHMGARYIWEELGYKDRGFSLRAISTECKIIWAEDDRLGPTVEELYGEPECDKSDEFSSTSAESSASDCGTSAREAAIPAPTTSTCSPTATTRPIPESSMRAVAVGNIFSWNDAVDC